MEDPLLWCAVHRALMFRPNLALPLLARFGTATRIMTASRRHLRATDAEWDLVQMVRAKACTVDTAAVVKRHMQQGMSVLPFDAPHYPPLLREIAAPPLVLYCRGAVETLVDVPIVALVGARKATAYGRTHAERLTAELAAEGVVTVSGLAFGIDAVVHRTSLAAGAPTIGVLASGVDQITPQSHCRLGEAVMRQGVLCSEYLPGTMPQPAYYPQRNRIISGLAHAVVVVEAAIASGSMWTARHALDQDRLLGAVPGPAGQLLQAGPHHLLRQGAIVVERASDLLEALNGSVRSWKKRSDTGDDGTDTTRRPTANAGQGGEADVMAAKILDALSGERSLGDIVSSTLGDTTQVLAALTLLEFEGKVARTSGGRYCRR